MDFLPKIYTIQAFDAPQHTERLRTILQEMQTEDRIRDFTVLKPVEDLSTLEEPVNEGDMILIVLTDGLEPQRAMIERKVRDFGTKMPGLRVAEILVDNIVYDNDFITFPDDLRPIRNREDMDEAWNSIARSLRDMFPVRQKKKAKPFPQWIVFVVLGVVLLGGILIFTLPTASGEEAEETFTRVPDLAGMSGTEAVSLLLDAGLEAGERSVESHDTVEKDLVIRSDPNAGESIEKGAQVNLILSGGRGQIPVPEVAGVTLDRARALLEGAGLRVGQQRSERSDQVEQGRVIRSDPGSGREVDRGSQVNLVISDGRVPIPVPDLRGMTLREASSVLERFELRVGQQQSEHNNEVERARVIRTDPGAGREIDRGSNVNLVFSLGRSVVERMGRFVVRQTWFGDFDRGRESPREAFHTESDFWFQARTATDRVIVPRNNAQLNILRGTSDPTLAEVQNALEMGRVSEIDVNRLTPGLWVAVSTSEGNYAAFTLEERVGPSPGELRVQYRYWSE